MTLHKFTVEWDASGRVRLSKVREAFELSMWETPGFQFSYAPAPRGCELGRTYRDGSTEAAWRTFLIGFRCHERMAAAIEDRLRSRAPTPEEIAHAEASIAGRSLRHPLHLATPQQVAELEAQLRELRPVTDAERLQSNGAWWVPGGQEEAKLRDDQLDDDLGLEGRELAEQLDEADAIEALDHAVGELDDDSDELPRSNLRNFRRRAARDG